MIMNLTERSYGQARNESFGSRDRSASVKRQYSDDRGEKKDQFNDNKRPFSPIRSAQNPESKAVSFKLFLSTVNMQQANHDLKTELIGLDYNFIWVPDLV